MARTFFSWARTRRYITHSPCEGLKPPQTPIARDRLLTDEEVARIHASAIAYGYPYGHLVRLLLYTGMRRNEGARMMWDYISETGITVPPELSKNGEARTIPLGNLTRSLLDSVPRMTPYAFPARGNAAATFSGFSKSKKILDKRCGIAPWVLHDLRRYFSSTLAKLGIEQVVTERLLGHTTGTLSPVARVYNRHQYAEEMREAINRYDDYLQGILSPAAMPVFEVEAEML